MSQSLEYHYQNTNRDFPQAMELLRIFLFAYLYKFSKWKTSKFFTKMF